MLMISTSFWKLKRDEGGSWGIRTVKMICLRENWLHYERPYERRMKSSRRVLNRSRQGANMPPSQTTSLKMNLAYGSTTRLMLCTTSPAMNLSRMLRKVSNKSSKSLILMRSLLRSSNDPHELQSESEDLPPLLRTVVRRLRKL